MKQLSTMAWTIAFLSGASFAQTTTLVSRTATGAPGSGDSFFRSISADGRYAAFSSTSNNLLPEDADYREDVFVYDRQTGTSALVSVSSAGVKGNADSRFASISADGRFVVFDSTSTNLTADVVPGDFPHIFLHDGQTGTTTLVSRSSTGTPANDWSAAPAISADGRYIAFHSDADNLIPFDTHLARDIFVHDRIAGTTVLVSVSTNGSEGNSQSQYPSISADGRYVAWWGDASNLVPNDVNDSDDVFVRDRIAGTTAIVSVASDGSQGNFLSAYPSISGDGRFVAFMSRANNLIPGDTNLYEDVFLRDRLLGTTELVSRSSSGVQGNRDSGDAQISASGRTVLFWSMSFNLVPNDHNGMSFFVRDLPASTTEMVDVNSSGQPRDGYLSIKAAISGDGRFVGFTTSATNVSPGDGIDTWDGYLRDRSAAVAAYCFGDGSAGACPCANTGAPGHGCQNSAATGGAILGASGAPSLSSDTLALTSAGELPSPLSILLQGSLSIAPAIYGDGLRCVGGALKRLYVRNAVGGVFTAPQGADPTISSRSAALGSAIPAGASRYYQAYYRDPSAAFCPAPPGNSWNVSSGLSVVWGY